MTTTKLTGAILLSVDEGKQIWVDEIEVEPAPTQTGALLWYVHEGKRHVLYLDSVGEPIDAELVDYIAKKHKQEPSR